MTFTVKKKTSVDGFLIITKDTRNPIAASLWLLYIFHFLSWKKSQSLLDWMTVLRACNEQQGECLAHSMPVRLGALSSVCSWIKASLSDEIKLLIISFHEDSWEPTLLHCTLILLIVFHSKLLHRTKLPTNVTEHCYTEIFNVKTERMRTRLLGQAHVFSRSMTTQKDTSKRGITDRDQNTHTHAISCVFMSYLPDFYSFLCIS